MAGGTITRIALGNSSSLVEEDFTGFYDTLAMSAGENNAFKAKVTNHGKPKEPEAGKHFIKGWWTDKNDKPIKEAVIGDTIRFHIQTKGIKDGEEVAFTVYDWDNLKWMNDKLQLTDKDTQKESDKIKIQGGKGYVEWTTGEGSRKILEESMEGNEIELFVECTYKDEKIDLPVNTWDYLILYEKEVLITVIVELPHSKETGWGAKGLAGHSAMAIGQRYFDYGPDYDLNNNGIGGEVVQVNEKDYDVDFNDDGDKDDRVSLDESTLNFKNAPGRPWWGEMVAEVNNISVHDVKLDQVKAFVLQHWHKNNVYGKVHTIEFYVKESEANKMIKWWEERYRHLKIYSVYPWTGEQCTTTVKTAIQQAFPFDMTKPVNGNYIPDTTQTPKGLLEDLKSFVSTSKKHAGQLSTITVIKQESNDWKN